jgi:hypothetical protein
LDPAVSGTHADPTQWSCRHPRTAVPQVWEIECLDGQIASCWQNRRKNG